MKKYFLFMLFAFSAAAVYAQAGALAQKNLNNLDKNGLAIKGYDPVAYFTLNKAVEGKKDISFLSNGSVYRFANTQNRDIFKTHPEIYTPQYGGWCAYAMGSTGEKVDIDPETFKLVDGKLFLFYNRFFNNTKKTWDKDEQHLRQQADKNWQSIIR